MRAVLIWRKRTLALRTLLFACLSLLFITAGDAAKSDPVAPETAKSAPNAGAAYVGSQACSGCHQAIYQQFTKTSMGRSMSLVTPAILAKATPPAQYFNERLHRNLKPLLRMENSTKANRPLDPKAMRVFEMPTFSSGSLAPEPTDLAASFARATLSSRPHCLSIRMPAPGSLRRGMNRLIWLSAAPSRPAAFSATVAGQTQWLERSAALKRRPFHN